MTPDWRELKSVLRDSFRSSFHFSVASVGADGKPHVTPIGSVLLTEPGRGFFFEIFTRPLPAGTAVSILGVNSSRRFWLASLFRGRFPHPPGLRLHGRIVGETRAATPEEQALFRRRVGWARWTKGYGLLWKRLERVRDLEIERSEWIRLGRMTSGVV